MNPDILTIRLADRYVIFLDLREGDGRTARLARVTKMLRALGAGHATPCSLTLTRDKCPDAKELAARIGQLLDVEDAAWILTPGASDRGIVVMIHGERRDAVLQVIPQQEA